MENIQIKDHMEVIYSINKNGNLSLLKLFIWKYVHLWRGGEFFKQSERGLSYWQYGKTYNFCDFQKSRRSNEIIQVDFYPG